MAIKRQSINPVVILDCVVSGVERVTFTNRDTGVVEDRGRKVTVQTGQGPELEFKVPVAADDVVFEVGTQALINVEYSEWSFTDDSGRDRSGSTMKYHSHVTAAQMDRWLGLVKSQARAAASA